MTSLGVAVGPFLVGCVVAGCDPTSTFGYSGGDESALLDNDGDGWAAYHDCDDGNAASHPQAEEVCDGIDNDCDGLVDPGEWFRDADGDGHGDPNQPADQCSYPDSHVPTNHDCNDQDPAISPGNFEICDGIDNNCDGRVDGGVRYRDADQDLFGNPNEVAEACTALNSHVSDARDCDDTNPAVNPTALELCDGSDNDCDASVDEGPWYDDGDGDGHGGPDSEHTICTVESTDTVLSGDCDDADPDISPSAMEQCNGLDEDCDGRVDDHLTCSTCEEQDLAFDTLVPDDIATIQGAIDAADPGERICVRAGIYHENLNFQGKDLALYGEAGASGTVIDASGTSAPTVTFANGETAAAVLQGFTLIAGAGAADHIDDEGNEDYFSGSGPPTSVTMWSGGGVFVDTASPTLTDLVVRGARLPDFARYQRGTDSQPWYQVELGVGGGLCFRESSSTLSGVDVETNWAWEGGGAYIGNDANIVWSQSWFTGNGAGQGGGGAIAVNRGSLALYNIVSNGNYALEEGGFIMGTTGTDQAVVITNATSVHDEVGSGGSVISLSGPANLTNVIVAHANADHAVRMTVSSFADVNVAYNLVWDETEIGFSIVDSTGTFDPTGASGNLRANPLFTLVSDDSLPGNDDLHLAIGSPAINTGDPTLLDADRSRSDMGAFGGPNGSWP